MYVMSYLKENIHSEERLSTCIKIIKYFDESHKIRDNEYISVYECILNINEPKNNIYKAFHTLLDLNVMEKCNFAICPICETENLFEYTNIVKCCFCRSTFSPDDINERFKFIYENTK